MRQNELTGVIVDCCYRIHTKLGPGLFEAVYAEILKYELTRARIAYRTEVPLPVVWEELKLEKGYRADFIIEEKVLLELKSVESLAPVHYKQVLTYIKLANLKVGLLINFNESLIKDGIHRIVNRL